VADSQPPTENFHQTPIAGEAYDYGPDGALPHGEIPGPAVA